MRKVTAEDVQAAMRSANMEAGSLTQFGVTFSLNRESLQDCGIAADWINAASGPDRLSCPGPNRQARAAQFGLTLDTEASRHPSQVKALATVESLRRAIEALPPDERLWTHFAAIISRPTFEAKFRGMQAIENDDGSLRLEWEGVTWQTPSPPRQDRIVEL